MAGIEYINELLGRLYEEASGGLVDKPPSRLSRGEGTEKNFFILKIDLANSTQMLMRSRKETYLRLAHTFLSSIDKITRDCGADPDQTEYAGDSVLAYFPENAVTAENVVAAACYSRAAVLGIQRLDATFSKYKPTCRVVLHFDALIVSKIGPRASSFITAIGHPIHKVAKIEKDISAGTGRVTEKFFGQVAKENGKYFEPIYTETQVPVFQLDTTLIDSLLGIKPPTYNTGLAGLLNIHTPPPIRTPPPPQYRIEKSLIGYNLRWPFLFKDLELNPV